MNYTAIDASGAVTASGSSGGSGGAAAGGKTVFRMGYLWPSSGQYSTSMKAHQEAVTDGGTTATVTQGDAASGPGTVNALCGYIYGTTGGYNYTWTLYKNGVATALTTQTARTSAGNSIATSPSVAFVAGDVLQVFSMADASATPQATKASLTVTLT